MTDLLRKSTATATYPNLDVQPSALAPGKADGQFIRWLTFSDEQVKKIFNQ